MNRQVVAVVGAGSVQTAPWVLASLASYYPDWPLEVRLCDPHPEQLGLASRLMEVLLKDQVSVPEVSHSALVDEALLGATDVVVTMSPHTAKRLVAPLGLSHLEALEAEPDQFELRKGDLNRPTHSSRMSRQTRDLVSRPVEHLSDSEAIVRALDVVREKIASDSRVAVVNPPVPISWADTLTFDPGGATDDLTLAYQILRWITDDEPIDDAFDLAAKAPLKDWLKGPLG
ncbi:MAG: hypothetical protein ABUL72_02470 [Armatimonadota bacterium]